jgi:predicted MFS family arabinose efflux permease
LRLVFAQEVIILVSLIHSMAVALHLSETTVAWVPTLAQIAYASGLLLLMPLGDILEKRRLLFILMLLASLGLLISGFSSHIGWIMFGTLITGLFFGFCTTFITTGCKFSPYSAQWSSRWFSD